ncbi:ferredoxin, partial [Bacillus thuringiensis]|nr:ferredoxin [Bacillus thuringiensis]
MASFSHTYYQEGKKMAKYTIVEKDTC